ncbi:MAG: hypothetical protein JWQ73_26 [Variovorax sp.]|nr:hypothetical protein [Variovorax sp.]
MSSTASSFARRAVALVVFAVPFGLATLAAAQTPPAAQPAGPDAAQSQEQSSPRQNQKIENIHVEDSSTTVDEVRYGGRTQSINVKPKSNMPGYEVLPPGTGVGPGSNDASNTNGNGPRVWNVLKF